MSDGRPSVPPFDHEPVSGRGVGPGDFLSQLSAGAADPEFVPGRRAPPPSEVAEAPRELTHLADEIAAFAETESSAWVRGRALAVAGTLRLSAGARPEGIESLQRATQLAPKLASVAAELRASVAEPSEVTTAGLESAARLAAHPSSRNHAALLLALHLLAEGDEGRAIALLDHVQRSGSSDVRVAVLRWILRQATGQPTTGIELPDALAEPAARAAELMSGRVREGDADHLELVRAARHLSQGDPERAGLSLLRSAEPSTRPLGLELLALRSGHEERVANLRRELVQAEPEPTRVRLAWRAALRSGETPSELLAPSALAALSIEERTLLGELLPLVGPASAESAAGLSVELRGVLEPYQLPEWPDLAFARSVRLGAALGTPGGLEGLEPPDVGSEEALAHSLLRVESSRRTGRLEEQAERLSELASLPGVEDAAVLASLLREKHGLPQLDDGAIDRVELSLLALARAAEGGERVSLLESAAGRRPEDELAADSWLEVALRRQHGRADALARAARGYGEPGLWLAALLFAEVEGSDAEDARDVLTTCGDPWLERWARLGRTWMRALEPSASSDLADALVELPADGLLRRAAEWRAGRAPTGSSSRWYAAQRAAHAWFEGNDAEAWTQLLDCGAGEGLGRTLLDEVGETLGQTARESERMLLDVRSDDPRRRYAAYQRLAILDRARGDGASALLWQKTAVEEFPDELGPLLELEASVLAEGRVLEWPYVRERLGRVLPPEDRRPYVELGIAAALGALAEREARSKAEAARAEGFSSLLGLRVQLGQALELHDDELTASLSARLAERATSDLDRAALFLEAASAELRVGDPGRAAAHLASSLEARPDSFPARLLSALLAPSESEAAALFDLARISAAPAHRAAAYLEAGRAWLQAGDVERAREAFVSALEAEPTSRAAFHELSELHLEAGDVSALTELLRARLRVATEPKEQVELGLRLAQLLLELELGDEARAALERALTLNPREPRVLRAHARLCTEAGDHRAAERSLLVLRDRVEDERERAAILRTLGGLYEGELNDLERAMDAYEGALALHPDDRSVERSLVGVFARLGLGERATNLQTRLIQSAPSDDEKRREALRLAELYEGVGRDEQRASATLERALKAWPLDAEVFDHAIAFLQRVGDVPARTALIERVKKDAERALVQGRLDSALFDTLGRATRAAGIPSQAAGVVAARAAFLGETSELPGAGCRAFEPALEEWLAPPALSAPLLRLLRRAGPVLDVSFPLDLAALGATKLTSGPTLERLTALCRELGMPAPELYSSRQLGARCQPITSQPPRFVVGPLLDELPAGARDYQLARALEFQRLGAAALARSRPEDAWSMVAALLVLFAPHWLPRGGDARKIAQARALAEQGLARIGYDDDVPTLALEAIGALGDRGPTIGEAVRTLGMRVALTFVGHPSHALGALSASADKPLPDSGPSRFRWFESHPEAKDVLYFSMSDEFARVREKLELAEARTHRAPLPPRAASLGPVPPRRS